MLLALAFACITAQNATDLMTSDARWTLINAPDVKGNIEVGDRSIHVNYDFDGHGGYVLAQRELALDLPENFEFSFWIKANSPRNNFEFKIMDPSGENVWWQNNIHYLWPKEWTRVVIRRKHIGFAWGPNPGKLKKIGSLQFGVAANEGGKGDVSIRDFSLSELPSPVPFTGRFESKFSANGLQLDLGAEQEIGGFVAKSNGVVSVETSVDGKSWAPAISELTVRDRFVARMPECQTRYLQIHSQSPVSNIKILPSSTTDTPNNSLSTIASYSKPGLLASYFSGSQQYWTVVGAPNSDHEMLISERGEVEWRKGGPCLQPYLVLDDQLIGAAIAEASQSMMSGGVPLPKVTWQNPSVDLTIEPLVTRINPETGQIQYTLHNKSNRSVSTKLILAPRPYQVNPTWQFLNTPGGFSPIKQAAFSGNAITINGKDVVQFSPDSHSGGTGILGVSDPVTNAFNRKYVEDISGFATACVVYDFKISPGAKKSVIATVSLDSKPLSLKQVGSFDSDRKKESESWSRDLNRIPLECEFAQPLIDLARAQLAYIYINRDGPRIQPGSRSYERTWIRDGSLTTAVLLRYGLTQPAKQLIEWYSNYIRKDGHVPCVVDSRGADPVDEHDSHGEFLYLLTEYYRFTHDLDFIKKFASKIQLVVDHLDDLCASQTDPLFFGLLPASISHEGYSAKPMHSIWDDFIAIKGYADAEFIAREMGDNKLTKHCNMRHRELLNNTLRSIDQSVKTHSINYIPGCVELGDYDATSTSIGLNVCDLQSQLPATLLTNTYRKYWDLSLQRMNPSELWVNYTPYELRNINALMLLGERDKAWQLLEWFMKHIRPRGWNHWAEVVWRNPLTPKFIGDMPHTWVGSEFLRSFRNFICYEDFSSNQLIIGRGIPNSWYKGKGFSFGPMPSAFGTIKIEGKGNTLKLSGKVENVILYAPVKSNFTHAKINGSKIVPLVKGCIMMRQLPSQLEWITQK